MKKCGVLLHISSLPSAEGIGTLGKQAYRFVDFLESSGLKCWQVLPLGATSYGDSPYQSPSAFASNPYFIDLEMLKKEGLLSAVPPKTIGDVDYAQIYQTKFVWLRDAFERFKCNIPLSFYEYCERESYWLNDYALFMSIKQNNQMRSFTSWEQPLIMRQEAAVNEYSNDCDFWKFLQYKFDSQWASLKSYANEKGIEIIGDMPIYVAYDSADVWANPQMFLLDGNLVPTAVAGVPPDAFSDTGQLWGNPLYNWDYLSSTRYDWWIKRVQRATQLFDTVRIDHFRGFAGYYSIPYGDTDARNGKWNDGVGEALFAEIKNRLGDVKIIAEDLGLLDETVYSLLCFTNYPGMKVLQFAFGSGDDNCYLPHNYCENCVAYTGTHDNQTSLDWYNTQPQEIKNQVRKVVGSGKIVDAMIMSLLKSAADTVVIPMQDFMNLGSVARMNTPSVLGGNWKWRLKSAPGSNKLAQKINDMLVASKRA